MIGQGKYPDYKHLPPFLIDYKSHNRHFLKMKLFVALYYPSSPSFTRLSALFSQLPAQQPRDCTAEEPPGQLGLQHRRGLRGEPRQPGVLHQDHRPRHTRVLRWTPQVSNPSLFTWLYVAYVGGDRLIKCDLRVLIDRSGVMIGRAYTEDDVAFFPVSYLF